MIMLESDRVHQENLLLNRGREEGREEGRIEGIAESRKEIAGRMLDEKLPEDLILRVSGLSEEELKMLKQENTNDHA